MDVQETSLAAFDSIQTKAPSLRFQVFREIASRGEYGGCDHEVQEACDMLTTTQTARRNELMKAGMVLDSGQRRMTPSNRAAIVWVVPTHLRSLRGAEFDNYFAANYRDVNPEIERYRDALVSIALGGIDIETAIRIATTALGE